ncbi:MAG TPA: thymidylate kinase [Candidatus Paceibacterota bacterium]
MRTGKLIVFDGIDGSGKATQSLLLLRRLKKEGKRVRRIEFPQYSKNVFGKLVGEYLRGAFGDFAKMDPRLASTLFAADRFESKEKIQRWLKAGEIVVADRYVSSNQIHQGGKIKDLKRRTAFLMWLDYLEYKIFGVPRPHVIIFLDVPVSTSLRLLGESKKKLSKKKEKYLLGKKDILESNQQYLKQSYSSALLLAKHNRNWKRITCTVSGELLSPQEIHEQVWEKLKHVLS